MYFISTSSYLTNQCKMFSKRLINAFNFLIKPFINKFLWIADAVLKFWFLRNSCVCLDKFWTRYKWYANSTPAFLVLDFWSNQKTWCSLEINLVLGREMSWQSVWFLLQRQLLNRPPAVINPASILTQPHSSAAWSWWADS